tara:strand:+ start:527 stop:2563 length:2037 start_codon:yes stop_codon:yes gene_type:complete
MAIQQTLLGLGGAKDPLYLNDAFQIHLYEGDSNNSRQITNGIDLAGDGGAVVTIQRSGSQFYSTANSARGATKWMYLNGNHGEQTGQDRYGSFNSDGYTMGSNSNSSYMNYSGEDYCSWTFKNTKGFFHCMTYTGDGNSSQQIAHGLGSTPGFIASKPTGSGNWYSYHRGANNGSQAYKYYGAWEANYPYYGPNANYWNNTAPTSTHFTVGQSLNSNGTTYVVYMFGHDEQIFGPDGDAAVVYCGYYTGNNSESYTSQGNDIDLGWEPQWLMIKCASHEAHGTYYDAMRGWFCGNEDDHVLYTSDDAAEFGSRECSILPNGFKVHSNETRLNANNKKYVYIAIRRESDAKVGKTVEEMGGSTKVFAQDRGTGSSPSFISNFPVDAGIHRFTNTDDQWRLGARERGDWFLDSRGGGPSWQEGYDRMNYEYQNGMVDSQNSNNFGLMWKRAPGYFDCVSFVGDSSTQTIPHGLGVQPEMMWLLAGGTTSVSMYHKDMANHNSNHGDQDKPERYLLRLNQEESRRGPSTSYWGDTQPTATQFTVGTHSYNTDHGGWMTMWLMASLEGYSKIGSYRGNSTSSTITINCGFTPSFIFIKRNYSGNISGIYSKVNKSDETGLDPSPSTNATPTMSLHRTQGAGYTNNRLINTTSTGFQIVSGIAQVCASPTSGWYTDYMYWAVK